VTDSNLTQISNAATSAELGMKTAIYLPVQTVDLVKKEFHLGESNIESFLVSMLEKVVQDHSANQSSDDVFTEAETKELENDLKGLGYI
jgi:hypothetical protein